MLLTETLTPIDLLGQALDVVVTESSRLGFLLPDTGVAQVPVVLTETVLYRVTHLLGLLFTFFRENGVRRFFRETRVFPAPLGGMSLGPIGRIGTSSVVAGCEGRVFCRGDHRSEFGCPRYGV